MFDLTQGATDVADAAAADAAAALAYTEARSPRAYAHFKYSTSGGGHWTVDSSVGCTIVLSGGTDLDTATITFDTAIGDTKYTVIVNGYKWAGANNMPVVASKASAVLVLTLPTNYPTYPVNGDVADFMVVR